MKSLRRTMFFVKKYWKTALGALISLLLVNAANLYAPQLLRQVIDQGIPPKDMNRIWVIAGMLILVELIRGVFNFLQGYSSKVSSQGVAYELRNVVFEKLQKLDFSYHDQSQTGKLMARMTSDVEMVRMFTGAGFLQLLSALILLIRTLTILFLMNVMLTGMFLLMIPLITVVFGFFRENVMLLSTNVQKKIKFTQYDFAREPGWNQGCKGICQGG